MRTQIVSVSLLLVLVGGAAAQEQDSVPKDRLLSVLPNVYRPSCDVRPRHYKVNSAENYMKTGIESQIPENRARALQEAQKLLLEAILKNKQDQNGAAWYYLARTYLQQRDLAGADSAFTRAEALLPKCKHDIETLRYTAWVPLVNAGITFANEKNADSAIALYRQANTIYPKQPQTLAAAGVLYANAGQTDSAIVYFRQAAEAAAARDSMIQERNQATFNLAAMLQQANRHAEAAEALEKYVGWVPTDLTAKRALAGSYRASGQVEKARGLERELLASSGGPTAGDSAGAAVLSTIDILNVGVNFYNDKKYQEAAEAFQKAVDAEPHNRDAIFNLANTYLAMNDSVRLREIAHRLVKIEPMNENALRLLSAGYRQTNDIDNAVKIAEQVLGLPLTVAVDEFTPGAEAAKLKATATGRAAQTATGKPIPPAGTTLVFEFLDKTGGVVVTQEAPVPALKPNETHKIELEAQGKGIVAWRYIRK